MKKFLNIILAIALCFTISLPVFADSDDKAENFYFSSFNADYTLKKGKDGAGNLHVTETLVAVFPNYNQNHGIKRKIPYTNQGGKNITIDSEADLHMKVYRNGEPEDFEVSVDSEEKIFEVKIGDTDSYVHGMQVYTLDYDFYHVITEFDSSETSNAPFQELYWDTNGTGWPQRFGTVTANFHIKDEDVLDKLSSKAWCYRGREGENKPCDIEQTYDGFTFSAEDLGSHENVTFVTNFKQGTFTIVDPPYNHASLYIAIALIAIAVLAFFLYRKTSYAKTKDKINYYKGRPVPPQYQPPKGYTVAEVASASFKTAKRDPLVATTLELVTSKKIDIIKSDEKGKKWSIKINSLDVTKWEKDVLCIIARTDEPQVGQTYEMKRKYSAANALHARDFTTEVIKSLKNKGDFEQSVSETSITSSTGTNSKATNIILAVIFLFWMPFMLIGLCVVAKLIILEITGEIFTIDANVGEMILAAFILSITLVYIIIKIINNTAYKARTNQGLDLANYAAGLELYIKMVEADRIKFLQSVEGADTSNGGIVKLYEKLLPYASLFGLEKSWMKTLEQYYQLEDTTAPDWYSAGFTYATLHNVTSSISSGTSGSSSSSSSGSGGGFSGGGGGGGGGGGW